jgi:hypothetical protein
MARLQVDAEHQVVVDQGEQQGEQRGRDSWSLYSA